MYIYIYISNIYRYIHLFVCVYVFLNFICTFYATTLKKPRSHFISLPQHLLPRRRGTFDARHTPYPQDRGIFRKDLSHFASNIITNPIWENICKQAGIYIYNYIYIYMLYGFSTPFLRINNVTWRWPPMKLGWDMLRYSSLLNKLLFAIFCGFFAATYLKVLTITIYVYIFYLHESIHRQRWMGGLTAIFADSFCYCSNV